MLGLYRSTQTFNSASLTKEEGESFMGIFDAFTKKKAMKKSLQPLEMPPPPEALAQTPEQPLLPTATSIPSFSLPVEQPSFSFPTAQMPPPEAMQLSEMSFDQQFPELAVPLPPEEEKKFASSQAPPETAAALPLEAPIRHPEAAFPAEKILEIPLEVSQELLTLPEVHRKAHPELYETAGMTAQPERKKQMVRSMLPKEYIPLSQLFEVGEQLLTLGEDIALAKDTIFRLTDLNEQEIEQMARWYATQQSIDLRIAEIDKLLFIA